QLSQLIKIESNNEIKLTELLTTQQNSISSKTTEIFFPVESSTPAEETNEIRITPMAAVSKGIKRSRTLFELEQEHERLLKHITDNRIRVNEVLQS
ncbi:unnamed protein product, partial [Adineta steineri]